ncbi:MAG TPA: HEAT repeat domain-containing protein [Candidatus Wallbacteria bacterium]|nr:HEAT repeat domain-containing protein [Candidatus Wallbacteria bacterium]
MAEKIFKDGKLVVIKSGRTIDDIRGARNRQGSPAAGSPPPAQKPEDAAHEPVKTSKAPRNNEPVTEDVKQRIESLRQTASSDSIISLIQFFSHPKWLARKLASEAIASLGEKSIPIISQTVFLSQSLDEDSLYWSIRTFGMIGRQATTALITLLNSANIPSQYKVFIIRAFETCKTKESINTLVGCFSDESWLIRREASNVLVKMGEMVVPYLKAAFAAGNEDVRYWSVKVLGGILGKGAIEYFKKMLKSEKRDMRYFATAALGEIQDEEALDALCEAFSDDSWLVRAQVSEILEKKGKNSLAILKKVLETGSSDAKFLSIKLMSKVMGKDAVAYISKIAQNADTELKFFTLSALTETMNENVIPLLVEALSDKIWLVRKHASSLLEKYGAMAAPSLIQILEKNRDENIRYWALVTLGGIGKSAHAEIRKIFKAVDKKEKITLIQSLNSDSIVELMPELFECFADSHWPVRNEAYKKLSEVPEYLVPSVFEYYNHSNADIKYWANQLINNFQGIISQSLLKCLNASTAPGDLGDELKKDALAMLLSMTQPEVIINMIDHAIAGNDEPMLEKLKSPEFFNGIFNLYLGENFDQFNKQARNFITGVLKSACDEHAEIIMNHAANNTGAADKIMSIIAMSKNHALRELYSKLSGKTAPPFEQQPGTAAEAPPPPKPADPKASASAINELLFEESLNRFLSLDEKEKLNFISNEQPIKDEKMLKLLISQFRIANESDCRWVALLVIEWWSDQLDYITALKETTANPKLKYWLEKIARHINGAEFI